MIMEKSCTGISPGFVGEKSLPSAVGAPCTLPETGPEWDPESGCLPLAVPVVFRVHVTFSTV